ncbi:RNA-binding protein 41 isoform X1 [Denticeps clupeoides]|uniref:RRM domain-containing protein n=1 Tax=Denticeps clupeoides TaxID=299321 RepID=A0AAY4EA28_9TELE|nr:RNA-binding protein 41 isoform X1 [Denticeps clupeoides]
MKRVTRRACDDAPIPEEQETEGQRQLRSLLLQQLDTDIDVDRCFAKKKCFAPAAFYKPFGEQAAGVKSLSQFQALQGREQELAGLRDLGLTDTEIRLWQNKDMPEAAAENGRGVCVAPEARRERLQIIQEKIDARNQILSRPQRLSASRPLSRREMEIERALFQGSDRQSFLSALYHQEEEPQAGQQGAITSDSLHSLYKDFLNEAGKKMRSKDTTDLTQTQSADKDSCQPPCESIINLTVPNYISNPSATHKDSTLSLDENRIGVGVRRSPNLPQSSPGGCGLSVKKTVDVSQPIVALSSQVGSGTAGPVTVSGRVEQISEEAILKNRASEEGIRSIPRFQNYKRGNPSNVLCVKNLSPRASVAQLVSLFSRFQCKDEPPILYRLLTGRLKGQAFITFSDKDTAQAALELLNGYRLLDKPLVIEFGRQRVEEGVLGKDRKTSSGVMEEKEKEKDTAQ